MSKQLPERSDLEQLKKQAKDLLDGIRAGQSEAVARVGNEPTASFTLVDAQRVLAREFGFESWPKLKLHVATRTHAEALARLAWTIVRGDRTTYEALRRERPSLGHDDINCTAALGDLEGLKEFLSRDPAAAARRGGPCDADPLGYLCLGRLGADDERRESCADLLLRSGADPHGTWFDSEYPTIRLPILYPACSWQDRPRLVARLLDAGTNPYDCESRYHASEFGNLGCLEVMKARGVDFSRADEPCGNTPLHHLCDRGFSLAAPALHHGLRWLLAQQLDPNVPSRPLGETPLHAMAIHGWPVEFVAALLDCGADPDRPRRDGRTPLALAVRAGRADLVGLMRRHGARSTAGVEDEFLGACWRGDLARVQEVIAIDRGIARRIEATDPSCFARAADSATAATLALMLDAGFDVESRTEGGASALQAAAWMGRADVVRLLIARGADVRRRDPNYDALPIGWCGHGSLNCSNVGTDYPAIAQALLDAGGDIEPKNRQYWSGSPEVTAVMKRHWAKSRVS